MTGYIKLRHSHEVRFHFGKHRISHAHLVDPESWVHDHDAPMITGVVGATFRALRHMEIEAETAAADSVVKGN